MNSLIPTNPSAVNNVHNNNSTLNTKKNVESNGLKSSKKIAESNIAPKDVSLDLNTTTKGSKDNLNASLDNNANPQNTKISQVKDEKLPSQPSTVASENLTPFKELAFPSSELDALEQKLNTAEETIQAPIADKTVSEKAAPETQAAKMNTALAPQKKTDKTQANKTAGKAQSKQQAKAKPTQKQAANPTNKNQSKKTKKTDAISKKSIQNVPVKKQPSWQTDSDEEFDITQYKQAAAADRTKPKTPEQIRGENKAKFIADLDYNTKVQDRVKRWQTKDANKIRSFIDKDKSTGLNVQHYKDLSDEEIKVQRVNHFIPGTELIHELPFYKEKYCIKTSKGCKIMASMYHEGNTVYGSVGFGITKGGGIYHQMFEYNQTTNGTAVFNYQAFSEFSEKPQNFKQQGQLYSTEVTEEGVIRFTYDNDHAICLYPISKKTMVQYFNTDHTTS